MWGNLSFWYKTHFFSSYFSLKAYAQFELLIDNWLFKNNMGSFKKKYFPKNCREIYAQIPPLRTPPMWGEGHIPPRDRISLDNPAIKEGGISSTVRNLANQ